MFSRFATAAALIIGHPIHFAAAVLTVLVWAGAGPFFEWSDTWQLFINTGTTVLTWLMVALLQHTQNRDTTAIQAKLDEIIRALPEADNAVRGIEKV